MAAACVIESRDILACFGPTTDGIDTLARQFCGRVLHDPPSLLASDDVTVYACGDMSRCTWRTALAIVELAHNIAPAQPTVALGRVPILVHGLGVYFRDFFPTTDNFAAVSSAHQFQDLTESTKPSKAFRKGVCLSKVTQLDNELHFHLLRCSSNFRGPTQAFEPVDDAILQSVNTAARAVFCNSAPINHVLAQLYVNTWRVPSAPALQAPRAQPVFATWWQYLLYIAFVCVDVAWCMLNGAPVLAPVAPVPQKAAIGDHSDKTKDMHKNGVIAFCTFYDTFYDGAFHGQYAHLQRSASDPFDFCYKGTSALTRLRFRLKKCVRDNTLPKVFDIPLYPNSVVLIPRSVNEKYTHAIEPSTLPIEHMPPRLGYVARCSKTRAVFAHGRTHVVADDGARHPLVPGSAEEVAWLRDQYFAENNTADPIDYGDIVAFSMNGGDYQAPLLPKHKHNT